MSEITRRMAIVMGVAAAAQAGRARAAKERAMEKVTGVGGVFFRARDPKKLSQWYADNLGVDPVPGDYDAQPWRSEAGTTIFAPFDEDTEYFGDSKNQWMINFRVRDLDAMAKQLRDNGINVEVDPQTYPNGRFARLYDPEGNPIELWQPGGKDPG